jgi:hypothetical protein
VTCRSYQTDAPTLKAARELAAGSRKTARDEANRRLLYLKGIEKSGVHPKDWMLPAVPVLPPKFRPVAKGGPRDNVIVSDANLIYADLINHNNALKELAKEVGDTGAERLALYDGVKAAFGLGEPIGAKNREKGVRGILDKVLGDTGKRSFVQQKLLGTTSNLSGRAQALPNPDLDLDEVGIPEHVAWGIYHPFVMRRLVRAGMPRVEAARHVADHVPAAKKALLEEMGERPVTLVRYPSLHRYNHMAFRPRLSSGDAVEINHMITKSYAADFDGDQQLNSVIVELTAEARSRTLPPGDPSFWEVRDMTARFRAALPIAIQTDGDATYHCVRLEDFPRGEKVGTKDHIDLYTVPSGVRVVAYDDVNHRPVLTEVSHWSVHRDRLVEIVTLSSGRQIVTDDDPRAVYGIDPETLEFRRSRPAAALGLLVPRVDRTGSLYDDATAKASVTVKVSEAETHQLPLPRTWLHALYTRQQFIQRTA